MHCPENYAYQRAYPHDPSRHDYPTSVKIVTPYPKAEQNFTTYHDQFNAQGKLTHRCDGETMLRSDKGNWLPTGEPCPHTKAKEALSDLFHQKRELEAAKGYKHPDVKAISDRISNGMDYLKKNACQPYGRLTFVLPDFWVDPELGAEKLSFGLLVTKSGHDIQEIGDWLRRGEQAAGSIAGRTWLMSRQDKQLATPLFGDKTFSVIKLQPADAEWIVAGMLGGGADTPLLAEARPLLLPSGDEDEAIEAEYTEAPL